MKTVNFDASRVSRAEALARELEQEIVDQSIPAGERLGTKNDIRERFGVAVATVNETIRILEMRGLVEARPGPGGGVFVAQPAARLRLNHLILGFKVGDAPFSDCLAVRNALEPLVIREAATYRTAAHARKLQRIVKNMAEHVDEPQEWLHLNWELHRQIALMCRNAPLRTLYLTLLDFVEDGLQNVRADEYFDGAANQAVHHELVAAIVSGDRDRVESAIAEHMPIAERWQESASTDDAHGRRNRRRRTAKR